MALNDPIDFGKYSTLFASSVALFAGAIEKNFGSFTNAAEELTGGLDQFTKFFSMGKILIDLTQLAVSLERTTVNLSRTFGSTKGDSYAVSRNLQDISKYTQLWGKGFSDISDNYLALRKELRNDTAVSLVETSAKISQIFSVSNESASILTATLARFAKIDGPAIESTMGNLAIEAKSMGFSTEQVTENLISDIEVMNRFGTLIRRNSNDFAKQAAITYSIGTNLKEAVTLADQLRTPGGAGEMAAKLSMLGIRVNPMALFAQAFGGNPAELQNRLYGATYSRARQLGGVDSNAARSLAQALGPMFGKSTDEVVGIWKRIEENSIMAKTHDLSATEWMKKMLYATNTNGQTLENSYRALVEQIGIPIMAMLRIITPAMKGLNVISGFLMNSSSTAGKWISSQFNASDKTQSTVGKVTGEVAGSLFTLLTLLAVPALARKTFRGLKGLGGRLPEWPASGGVPSAAGDAFDNSRIPGQRGFEWVNGKNAPVQTLTAPQMIARMGGAALVMVAFAGSIFILSKAFRNFSEVDWKGASIGATTMVAFAAMSFVIAKGISALGTSLTNPMFLAGIAVMATLSAAVWGVSVAFKNFGEGIKIGAEGFQILGNLNISNVRTILDSIGEWADLYSPSLDSASRSVERIAKAMGKLSDNVASLDIVKARELFSMINPMPTLAGAGAGGYSAPVEVTAILKTDGREQARTLVRTTKGPKGK